MHVEQIDNVIPVISWCVYIVLENTSRGATCVESSQQGVGETRLCESYYNSKLFTFFYILVKNVQNKRIRQALS